MISNEKDVTSIHELRELITLNKHVQFPSDIGFGIKVWKGFL